MAQSRGTASSDSSLWMLTDDLLFLLIATQHSCMHSGPHRQPRNTTLPCFSSGFTFSRTKSFGEELSGVGEKQRLPHDTGKGKDSRDALSDTGEVSLWLGEVDAISAVWLALESTVGVFCKLGRGGERRGGERRRGEEREGGGIEGKEEEREGIGRERKTEREGRKMEGKGEKERGRGEVGRGRGGGKER